MVMTFVEIVHKQIHFRDTNHNSKHCCKLLGMHIRSSRRLIRLPICTPLEYDWEEEKQPRSIASVTIIAGYSVNSTKVRQLVGSALERFSCHEPPTKLDQ